MLENPDQVVLGCRRFDDTSVPARSLAGNRVTSGLFRLLFGIRLTDTQTGLRAIPSRYLKSFCEIGGERFEYETNMLLQMKADGIGFLEQPITAVYEQAEHFSHFDTFADSFRIGKVMLRFLLRTSAFRFALDSVLAFLVDNGLYYLLLSELGLGNKALFQILSRLASSSLNFHMNKFFAFRTRKNYRKELLKYYSLCVPMTAASLLCVNWSDSVLNVTTPALATAFKICIEAVLFLLSFLIQKKWVFSKKKAEDLPKKQHDRK